MRSNRINRKFLEYIAINQKNIGIMLSVVIVAFFIFWFFIYSPKRRQMKKIEFEYKTIRKDIKKIEAIAGGEEKLDISLEMLDKKLKMLEEKLPQSEEITFKELSGFANRSGIEVVSLTPKGITESSIQGNIPGYKCMELSIGMDLRCTYKTLGEYLRLLQEDFPTLVRIKSISMSKEKPGDKTDPALRAHLVLTMYMLHAK